MPLTSSRGFRVFEAVAATKPIHDAKAPSVEDFIPVGPNPREDRTARMNGYAQAAINRATEASEESQMLDYRIQKAAYDYAKTLTPELMKKMPEPVKPKFTAYEYQEQDPIINQVKVAE